MAPLQPMPGHDSKCQRKGVMPGQHLMLELANGRSGEVLDSRSMRHHASMILASLQADREMDGIWTGIVLAGQLGCQNIDRLDLWRGA